MTQPPSRSQVISVGARQLLRLVYSLVAVLTASALYLGAVTAADWLGGTSHQGYVYQWALLVHLGVGLIVLVPFLLFAVSHALVARRHPNQQIGRAHV